MLYMQWDGYAPWMLLVKGSEYLSRHEAAIPVESQIILYSLMWDCVYDLLTNWKILLIIITMNLLIKIS